MNKLMYLRLKSIFIDDLHAWLRYYKKKDILKYIGIELTK